MIRQTASEFSGLRLKLSHFITVVLLLGCVAADGGAAPRGQHSTEAKDFELPSFKFSDIQDPTPETLASISDVINQVGMFSVTDVTVEGVSDALAEYARCVLVNDLGEEVYTSKVKNHTQKTTLAVLTNGTSVLPLPERIRSLCPRFTDSARALRHSVDIAGRVYARLLDRAVQGASDHGPVSIQTGDSFVSAVLNSESLEHFHLFQTEDTSAAQQQQVLDLHSDMGLFIIMTAAEYVDLSKKVTVPEYEKPETGLYLELPDGEIVRPKVPDNSLLIMNGDGIAKWIRTSAFSNKPYSPAHEVILPDMSGLGRVWFGRMYLPPRDARLEGTEFTFGQYREQTVSSILNGKAHEASTAGCAPTRRALVEVTDCGAGELYCWMSCLKIPSDRNCSAEELICKDPATDKLWPQDYLDGEGNPSHCFECGLFCPDSVEAEASVCNTNLPPTTMWMLGFQVVTPTRGCIAYLFQGWVLDNGVKFAFACIGTLLMGLGVEGLVCFRRSKMGTPTNRPALRIALMLLLYATQVTAGYLLMLVAMTYQVELFAMVIVGLVMGHGLFNLRAPVAESAEACCQGLDPNQGPGAKLPMRSSEDKEEAIAERSAYCCSSA